MDENLSVALIEALAAIWTAIRSRHPEVPGVVLLPAPAVRMNVLGHFAPLRWVPRQKDDQLIHEVVVSAEYLDRKAEDIVETMLHEAAHALNFARGIKDCSANQYHNRRYRVAAEELGLEVSQVQHYGFALTSLPENTADQYRREMEALESVLIHRRRPHSIRRPPGLTPTTTKGGKTDKTGSRNRKAICACGYIIRVSKKTMQNTVIRCESCDEPFCLV